MSSVRRGSVDPRWRSGRSPATPDRLRERKVPHFNPLCNTIVVIRPTFLERSPSSGTKSLQISGVAGWGDRGSGGRCGRRTACIARDLQRFLRSGGCRPYASAMPRAVAPRSHLPVPPRSPAAAARARRAVTIRRAPCRRTPPSTSTRRVRPEGDLREDALAAAGKVLRTLGPAGRDRRAGRAGVRRVRGPEARLREGHRAVARREGRDLGGAASGEDDFRGAVVATATDEEEAQAAIDRARRGQRQDLQRAHLRGRRLPGSTDERRRHRRGLRGVRHRGRVQADHRRGQGRRRWTPTTATAGDRTGSRTTGSARSTSTSRR